MIFYIDNLLNRITMYRLVLYYLTVLVLTAFVFAFFSFVPYSPWAILTSVVLATAVCYASNEIFAKVFKAATNVESVYITAFILALIVPPALPTDWQGLLFVFWASVLAMASKYIIAIGRKHIFNPAALAVAITALALGEYASWWVGGNVYLLPVVLVGGLLVVRKLQRFDLVLSFTLCALATISITSWPQSPLISIQKAFLHSPLIFLACIMLTEPLSTPPTRGWRLVYGAIVGVLFAPAVHVWGVYSSPELSLVVGNIFSYFVSPKGALMLTLIKIEEVANGVYSFIFTPDRKLAFSPGQYLEWTLPHTPSDARGNRRYFTIASSPTEEKLRLGVKIYEPSSSFKRALKSMKPGDTIAAGQLAGDFTLPKDPKQKLVFIAGGIGITPFRSQIQHLLDTNQHRDIVLFYSNKKVNEIAYKNIFDRARSVGVKTVYAITNENAPEGMFEGFIDAQLIAEATPDYRERKFYISGPRSMVVAFEKTLSQMGVPRFNITVDFFPGFV